MLAQNRQADSGIHRQRVFFAPHPSLTQSASSSQLNSSERASQPHQAECLQQVASQEQMKRSPSAETLAAGVPAG